jgi:putative addiction module killer protein
VWLSNLARPKSKGQNLGSPSQRELGNFGDCEPVGEGVSESVSMSGRGIGSTTLEPDRPCNVLLAGGVKASQTKDIAKAKKMAREWKKAKR